MTEQQVDAQGSRGGFVMELAGVLEKARGAPSRCFKAESGRSFPSELAESLYSKLYKAPGTIRGLAQRRRDVRRAFPPCHGPL